MIVDRCRILLVDDDFDVREVYAEALVESGYDVVTAPNGRDALTYLEVGAGTPAMILVDLMMPVMGGREFILELRQRNAYRETPVLIMTASRTNPGIDGVKHIFKPFSLEMLCEAVRELLAEPPGPGS